MKEPRIFDTVFETADVRDASIAAVGDAAPAVSFDFECEAATVADVGAEVRADIEAAQVKLSAAGFKDKTQGLRLKQVRVLRAGVRSIPIGYPLIPLSSAGEEFQRRLVSEIAVGRKLNLADVTVVGVHHKVPVNPRISDAGARTQGGRADGAAKIQSGLKPAAKSVEGLSYNERRRRLELTLPREGRLPDAPAMVAVLKDKNGALFIITMKREE